MKRLQHLIIALSRMATVLLLLAFAGEARATSRSFGAGSYIIPADFCWQPNNDPAAIAQPGYCDPNKNDQSLFQSFGMLYALLDTGDNPSQCSNNDGSMPVQRSLFGYCKEIKVYWIIDDAKVSTQAPDLTLADPTASAEKPLVTIYNSTKTGTVPPASNYVTKANSGAATAISYFGGPYAIDVNDLTPAEFETVKTRFPSVKLHKANVPFTGNVSKVLIGRPPRIAVLNEGASTVLENYLRASGGLSWRNAMFQYVGGSDVLAGCLANPLPSTCTATRPDITAPFQMIWAPHWTPPKTDAQTVVGKIRNFLEAGNNGLFECASIETMEGSAKGGASVGSAGGFTIGSALATPRIDTNGGCSDTKKCTASYLKFEQPSFWLNQCGGWNFKPTGGSLHNFRPSLSKSYRYLTTAPADDAGTTVDDRYVGDQLTRFIHDDPTQLKASYAAGTGSAAGYYVYDYLMGGRINGSPSQGYVVYLPGHSYISCGNKTTYSYPPSRVLELQFDAPPPNGSVIYLEAVHSACTQGVTCPKVAFDTATGIGSDVSDRYIDVSAESATLDPVTVRLSGITITFNDSNAAGDLQITDLYVTFDGNGGKVRLANIADLTVPDSQSLCAPWQTSTVSPAAPVRCSLTIPETNLSLTFSGNVTSASNKKISVVVSFVGGQLTVQYDIGTKTGTSAATSKLSVDLRSATWDPNTNTLSGLVLKRGSACADTSLTDIRVTFPGDGTFTGVYNSTTSETVCTANQPSTGGCSSAVTGWSYTVGRGICSYYLSPYLSSCSVNWGSSNTCGIKFVLNTVLAVRNQTGSGSDFSKTQPIVQDNILYKASYDYPAYRGHLRMIQVPTDTRTSAATVWDAAGSVPPAGTGSFPGAPLSSGDTTSARYIFTHLPGSTARLPFDPAAFGALNSTAKAALRTQLDAGSDNDAIVTINTVRGRTGASAANLSGTGEDPKRLWGIENSTPALKVKSKYVEATAPAVSTAAMALGRDRRDRILFAGADDGMLHAFWGGSFDPASGSYPDTSAGNGTGKEIWAFIPSSLLSQLKNQPFTPDPNNEASFEPKVAVDGSPALGDFLVCTEAGSLSGTCNRWQWKTRLVGTATVRSQNRGIVFALDVTDPYDPQLLWENTYDLTGDAACAGSGKNCNMGNSKGGAIGTVQIGKDLKDYVFLTSSWIQKKKPATVNLATNEYSYALCAPDDTSSACVYGVSAYALDLSTGQVVWERPLPYNGDAAGINETPAVPALMDRDNNGSYDYVVFGDMQGRLWALRTTDGKNITDLFSASDHVSRPVYQLTGSDGAPTGAGEPIGAPVAVYRDYVVLATGGAEFASNGSPTDARAYRVKVVKIGTGGGTEIQSVSLSGYDTLTGKGNEKVWAKPAITSDLKVYVGTARSYFDSRSVSSQQSDGRVMVIDLRVKPDPAAGVTNVGFVGTGSGQWHAGGFVGGFDFDRHHAYAQTLRSTGQGGVLQIGSQMNFSAAQNKRNNFKVLWWRKL